MRRALLAAAILVPVGCAPELGDAPFACGIDGACPEGYGCRSTVCVREGAEAVPARPARVTWINAAELHWVARPEGGAALVVNDGFTPGAHGLYEIGVSPDGLVEPPRLLYPYGDELPISSSVVALDDERYAAAMLRFPRVDEDAMTLEVLAIARGAPEGAAPGIETLYREREPFLGGVEPSYIGAVTRAGAVHVAWTRPSLGGRVEVVRIARSGSVWSKAGADTEPLPAGLLPLSGDCALWPSGDDLVVRVGFEAFAVGTVGADGALSPLTPLTFATDVPLYAAGGELLLLRYGDYDDPTASYPVSWARADLAGQVLEEAPAGSIEAPLELYSGTPYEGGALIAPLPGDAASPELSVGFWAPGAPAPVRVARVPRASRDDLYTARAFAADGKVYLAWTEFHESQMDLWVATADMDEAPGASP